MPSWRIDNNDGGDYHGDDGDDYNSEGIDDYRKIVCEVDDGDRADARGCVPHFPKMHVPAILEFDGDDDDDDNHDDHQMMMGGK